MTIERLPEQGSPTPELARRTPGARLAVLALTDQLDAERADHAATRAELIRTRRQLLGALVGGRVATYARELYEAWALPQVGGGIPPVPPAPLSVDLTSAPLIYDALVAELGASPLRPPAEQPSAPARRRTAWSALPFLVVAVLAALLTRPRKA